MIFKNKIVFPNQRSEWNNDMLLAEGREGRTYLAGCSPMWEGGLKLIFEGEAEKILTKMEKPNIRKTDWDKEMEVVSSDQQKPLQGREWA